MKLKLNWGFGIFVFYSSFVVFMLFLVYMSFQQKVDLVSEDYYQLELEYQDIIAKKINANKLVPGLVYTIEEMSISFSFPDQQNNIQGDIIIYRPSDKTFDKAYKIKLDARKQMSIRVENSPQGLYKMMVTWMNDSIGYYVEKDIYLKQ